MREDIPAVDLSLGEDAVASTIRRACTTHGFFYVVNHGVSDEEVGAMVRAMKAFFALPEEKKRTVLQDENNRGWTPMGEETLDPATQVSGDTKEGYYIGREIAPDSPEFGLPLRGANNWPDESALGLSAPFRAPMRAYHAACVRLCRSLMRPFALALDMPPDFFDDKFTHPTAISAAGLCSRGYVSTRSVAPSQRISQQFCSPPLSHRAVHEPAPAHDVRRSR